MIIDAMSCKQTDFDLSTAPPRARPRAHTHTHTQARTHERTHARAHARTHARTHTHTHTHTRTHLDDINNGGRSLGDDESGIGGSEEDEVLFK